MSETSETIEFTRDAAGDRFVVTVDGAEAGFADFSDADGARTFPHTVVHKEFGGRGLAGRLVRHALDATRADGLRVIPACSFVEAFIEKNPEYADLVA